MITYWHRLAHLYIKKELALMEIVLFCLIAESVGMFEGNTFDIGYNVLDHSQLNNALVYGVLKHYNNSMPITYKRLAEILHTSPRVIGLAVNRLTLDNAIVTKDYGTGGKTYTLLDYQLSQWIIDFTKALYEMNCDSELLQTVKKEAETYNFYENIQKLKQQIRDKFGIKIKTRTA